MPRALKISAWVVGSLLALVALLVIAVLIVGNTESGRALVVRMTSRLTDGHVQLAGIHGSFPAALDLDKHEAQVVTETPEGTPEKTVPGGFAARIRAEVRGVAMAP